MKQNFRYITKFEEETRSARLETRKADLYFATYSQALSEVKKTLDEQGWQIEDWSSITSSKKKPSEGETVRLSVPVTHNRYAIDGDTSEGGFDNENMKIDYGQVEIQVYNKGNDTPKPFELNFYTNKTKKRSSSTRLETREAKERVFTATSSEERGRWEIDVELNGKTVFRYDSDSHNPDEEGYEPTEGGWMKNLTDYQGLADWMSHMGVMDKGETLVVERGSDKGRYYARSSSARLETRSLGGGGEQSLDKYQKDFHGWRYFVVYDYLPSMIDKTLKGWQIVNDEGSVLIMYNKQAGYSLEQLNQLMDREGWKMTKISDTKYSITTKKPSTTIHDSKLYKTKS